MRLITPNRKPMPPVNRRSNIVTFKKTPVVHEHGNLTPQQILDKKVEVEWAQKVKEQNEEKTSKKDS